MESQSIVIKTPVHKPPPEMRTYQKPKTNFNSIRLNNFFEISNIPHKTPLRILRIDKLLQENLSLEAKEKINQAEKNAQIIMDQFCDIYGFGKKEVKILLANLENCEGEHTLSGEFRYVRLDKYFVEFNSLESIVHIIIHEYLHFLSKGLQKGIENNYSKIKKVEFSEVGLSYKKLEKKEWKNMSIPLNEALVETVATVISFETKEKYIESVKKSSYGDLVRLVLKLMEYLDKLQSGNAKEFFDLMVETLQTGKPYLIIRFLKEKTGITLKPKELLAADFGRILNKEILEKKSKIPSILDLPIIGEYKFNGLIPDQKISFKSPNLVVRIITSAIIFDSAEISNITYLDFDEFGNFEKICVNEPDICRDILNKENDFPLREVLEMELEKVEIPYFGADFWQKVPKAKT